MSICFGSPDRAREWDPQEAMEAKLKGFRGLLSSAQSTLFHRHLQLVCDSELFDDHVMRITSDMPSQMAHHLTYLGMAMFQCGLSEKEGKDAMKRCIECKPWLLHNFCLRRREGASLAFLLKCVMR